MVRTFAEDRIQPTPELRAEGPRADERQERSESIRSRRSTTTSALNSVTSASPSVSDDSSPTPRATSSPTYGDCKDKHTLLSAMLASSAFTPIRCLLIPQRQLDPDVPSPGQFDHVISLVTVGDKGKILLDTTPEVAPFRLAQLSDSEEEGALGTDGRQGAGHRNTRRLARSQPAESSTVDGKS